MSLLFHIASPRPSCPSPALGNSLNVPATSLFLCPKDVHPRPRTPRLPSLRASAAPDSTPNANHGKKKKIHRPREANHRGESSGDAADEQFPTTIPRKPRRGRRSEAAAVEDFVRESLERTFISIREQNREALKGKPPILKEKAPENSLASEADWVVTEEEDRDWPLDADVGWGVRASEYFEKHPIKNVVVDGEEIDWEGDMEEGWVKEINCLEWERFAFHPSPLIVLVFERYNRAAENWRLLKELEKAAKVYWSSVDRLPPRTVKVDMNIERDLAYALQVRECPQLLFLRGNKILFREKEHRTADQLVQMIAHFYYNAKKPSWIKTAIAPSYPC